MAGGGGGARRLRRDREVVAQVGAIEQPRRRLHAALPAAGDHPGRRRFVAAGRGDQARVRRRSSAPAARLRRGPQLTPLPGPGELAKTPLTCGPCSICAAAGSASRRAQGPTRTRIAPAGASALDGRRRPPAALARGLAGRTAAQAEQRNRVRLPS